MTCPREVIALITARGGSKRLPGKNIKMLAGKPLIAWTIAAAKKSRKLARVLVSTDDPQIAAIAKRYGAEIPFLRPARLARDSSTHISVAVHLLEWFRRNEGKCPEYLMLLQPTSPLRTARDIDAVIDLAERKKAEAVIAVHEMPVHPFLAREISKKGLLRKVIHDGLKYRRKQALPAYYAPNGAIYLTRSKSILKSKTFFPLKTYPYVMPQERSVDVDTPWDFELAGLILRNQGKS